MADQVQKNQNQNGSASGQQNEARSSEQNSALNTKSTPSLDTGSQTRDIVKQQRDATNSQGVVQQQVFNALFGTKTAAEPSQPKSSVERAPSRLRSKGTHTEKEHKHGHHHQSEETSVSAEVRELMAIRAATSRSNQGRTASAASNRGGLGRNRGGQSVDGEDPSLDEGLQATLVGTDSVDEGIATGVRFGSTTEAELAARSGPNQQAPEMSPQQALDGIELRNGADTQKLLDLVGPEAILTFREKLQQVWVTLDDSAARQLDVIARMPATLTGSTAIELLMVESPQGIHFVAFLKNKNDFDVLATFDRRALLPDSPSRQLIEAGLMAYEQLESVFKEGGQKIEQSVKELAQTRGTNDVVFMELQKLMVQEKRRRRNFRQMVDYFVDKLDELDLNGDPETAPFVPNDLNAKAEEADSLDDETKELDDYPAEEQEGFALKVDDSDDNSKRRSGVAV